MATINSFENLKVWGKLRVLCQQVFGLTQTKQFDKDYALRDQINRSSGSVMNNISEGFGRQSSNEFINFLTIAYGSALEVKSQLYRALDRKYVLETTFNELSELLSERTKMLTTLIAYLNKSDIIGLKFKARNPAK